MPPTHVLRASLLAALLATPVLAHDAISTAAPSVQPTYAAQNWSFDVTTTGNDIHWTSPTAVDPNAIGYDAVLDITLATVNVSFSGIPFGPIDVLPNLPPEALHNEINGPGPAPFGILAFPVVAPPPPDAPAISGDLSSGLDASGFGFVDFVNVALGTFQVDLGFPFGTVTATITSVRVAGTVSVAETQWVELAGTALAGTNALEPHLHGSGPLLGNDLATLDLTDARASTTCALVIGVTQLVAPFKGGVLVPNPDIIVAGLPTGAAGALSVSFLWPTGLPPGVVVSYQYWVTDPAGPVGFAASNGLTSTTP
ncbi:MAG: hypothetical protein H6825_01600 [Planctomycetes bacterium]|nr:hypothetical protein [Planctomycetota bacterium]